MHACVCACVRACLRSTDIWTDNNHFHLLILPSVVLLTPTPVPYNLDNPTPPVATQPRPCEGPARAARREAQDGRGDDAERGGERGPHGRDDGRGGGGPIGPGRGDAEAEGRPVQEDAGAAQHPHGGEELHGRDTGTEAGGMMGMERYRYGV